MIFSGLNRVNADHAHDLAPGELFWAPEYVLDLVAIFIYIHASGSFYVNIR